MTRNETNNTNLQAKLREDSTNTRRTQIHVGTSVMEPFSHNLLRSCTAHNHHNDKLPLLAERAEHSMLNKQQLQANNKQQTKTTEAHPTRARRWRLSARASLSCCLDPTPTARTPIPARRLLVRDRVLLHARRVCCACFAPYARLRLRSRLHSDVRMRARVCASLRMSAAHPANQARVEQDEVPKQTQLMIVRAIVFVFVFARVIVSARPFE